MTGTLHIVVLNPGASTVKLALMEVAGGEVHERRRLQREWRPGVEAADIIDEALESLTGAPDAFGYRVVHGGADLVAPVTVDAGVERRIAELVPLAPLHNAPALTAIRAVRTRHPHLPGVAVFDTAFHADRPAASTGYALPATLVQRFGFRRYGFHGIAHASLVEAAAAVDGVAGEAVSAVTLQLGAGCSACAVRHGRSIETSMGFTPLEGLVMATRCGSVDPAVVLNLVRGGHDADWIEDQLTRHSGLLALAGTSDMREILAAEARGEPGARLALDLFCHRLVLTVGGYLTLLEGQGALVFGGGIGTHSPQIRRQVAAGLRAWNVSLDEAANTRNEPGRISAAGSRAVFALRTDEESMIARAVAEHLS